MENPHKIMLSDDEAAAAKTQQQPSVRPSKRNCYAIVATAIVVACVLAIGLGVGLGVGLNKKNGGTVQQAPAIVAVVNGTMLTTSLHDATADAVAAVNEAFAHLVTEAVHDSFSWEAYVMAREGVVGMLPALAISNSSSVTAFLQALAQADYQMLDVTDVDATYVSLQAVAATAQAVLANTNTRDSATQLSPKTVLQRLQAMVGTALLQRLDAASASTSTHRRALQQQQTSAAAAQQSSELLLLDLHQALLSAYNVIGALPAQAPGMAGVQSSLAAATTTIGAFAVETADLWLTKAAKAESCADELDKGRVECDTKLGKLLAGEGCTPGPSCDAAVAKARTECADKAREVAVKCSSRRSFLKVCGNEYEAKLAQCRGGLQAGTSGADLVRQQWACKAAADLARNICIQREEYVRKCDEEVDKKFRECTAKPGSSSVSCGAANTTVRASCQDKERPKRMDCKVSKRSEEIRKCANVEESGYALCAALLVSPQRYGGCMQEHNSRIGECKFRIEAEVKKCEEESPCKATESAAKAKCQTTYDNAVASGTAAAVEAATAAKLSCEAAAKSASESCKMEAAAKVSKWVGEQATKKEVVTAVQRYYEYLPYSLLNGSQRTNVRAALTSLAAAMAAAAV
ncbi:hypothetical protein HYH02_013550 [Chlamydomonas schloesseri]|uniref:Uncharacterized protein n=1 Tax=Chlamydomonas schloesseri TaxID=2026947 RepID=A0A835VZU2_9CHLO|nr:hypothetical protein HYH02_013550 [Chlamydomonas schloesseri]|eukprot:KAG2431021.1 hypothetical protein HYH02_013550 [Chlamydomonas schloesseri]